MSYPAPPTPDDRADAAENAGVGRHFQHYEVLRHTDGSPWELGRGTMGITYKAFDVNLCCEVALKVVNAALLDHPNARERFVREARAAAALRHRNVASVYHLGNDGERFFYAMEFIDGETLDALVRREGPLPVEEALRVIQQAARALAAADRQHLVHRDIKPANIMVVHEDDDDHRVVKVIDFGLARPVSGGGTSAGALTVGGFVGTPQFASPEQLEEHALDIRSDIYSLGVTTWFLLTGKAPFTGSLATICQAHLTHSPPWELLPGWLPTPVRRLLGRMLEKDPARRPQNPVELRREIDACRDAIQPRAAAARRAQVPSPSPAPAPGNRTRVGSILAGRYELVRSLGETRRGRLFEARDTATDGEPVSVTLFTGESAAAFTGNGGFRDEVRLAQAAPHPHLTRVLALEPPADGTPGFLVEERTGGGTLVDLLAARAGVLSAVEGLRLLGQAAAASDHAAIRGLQHLGLAVHQVCLHFFTTPLRPGSADTVRGHLAASMNEWPAWTLKINPLASFGEQSEMHTWTGEVTLVPGIVVAAGGGSPTNASDAVAAGYLRALAAMTYELLGGASGSWVRQPGTTGKYVSLPALNEEANRTLHQAFEGKIPFGNGRLFYEKLARAAGFDPVSLQLSLEPPANIQRPTPSAKVAGTVTDLPTKGAAPAVITPGKTGKVSRAAAVPKRVSAGSTTFRPASRTSPPFFAREDSEYPADDSMDLPGSISDRLTLVSGEPLPIGRWLLGVAALLAVFVLAVVGVWIALAQRLPRDEEAAAAQHAPNTIKPISHPAGRPAALPRPTVPPPLPANKESARTPAPTPAAAPTTNPRTGEDQILSAATPASEPPVAREVAASPPLAPVAEPPPAKLVRVRIKSIPPGAEIQSAGRTLGTTPVEVELPPGTHELVTRLSGWPETHETVSLRDDQSNAAVEIHLMPPGLVPSADMPSPAAQINRPRRFPPALSHAPANIRRVVPAIPADGAEPFSDEGSRDPAATPTRPEVRRALPPLTPFDPDGPLESHGSTTTVLPSPSPAGD